MTGPTSLVAALPDDRARRRLRLAYLVLRLEALWPAVVGLASMAALFVALALFDLLPRLPGWLHGLVLLGFAGALVFLLRLMLRSKGGDWLSAARRLEADGGLTHRPFQVLLDQPVGGDQSLWEGHRRRAVAEIARARLSWPRSNMAAQDPLGLRAGALLLLAVALAGGGHDWTGRMARALVPALILPGLGPDTLEVWVTPPAYTGLPPLLLRQHEPADDVVVPSGSTVLAVLSGGWGRASLVVDGHKTGFTVADDGGQRVESQIQGGKTLAIRQLGRDVASWPLRVVADLSPAIDFTSAPEPAERGRLHMAVAASDDHGLSRLWVEIRRLGAPFQDPPVRVELPLPAGRPKQAGSSSWHDLTAHPWAGLPVVMQPMAEDALGQRGAGEVVSLSLPERSFLNPNAQAVIEQRRQITQDRRNAPGAMGVLDRLAVEPARFNDDSLTFLALRTARHALASAEFSLPEVQDLLWNAALRIEDGDLAAAEQRLEDARRALEQAIEDDLSGEGLNRLLDQFQAALHRYLAALDERMGQPADDLSAEATEGGATISEQELQDMLQSMRDMAAIGARDGLKKMLREMSGILDALQTRTPQAPSSAASQAIRGLRDLAQRQQRLLEQSHRNAQESASSAHNAQRQQDEIRQSLGSLRQKLREGLGQEPVTLEDAEQAMAEAMTALQHGDWNGAVPAQTQALDNLSQAIRQALETMAAGSMTTPGGLPRDPLGRPAGNGSGGGDDGATRVPDQTEMRKARAILDELRRRAGELTRPQAERDYLQRLLRQF
ncbi:DUF4175 domain-containing protein [Magnetospirillum sulfuroxidans]|uniref:DUF4175 family protein n=1 Tax=Magnetospirillum sulfuroxidans TaxID=611300 RepID=A0ABS5ID15_9PROT|nr:DUF4175 family protein [Magnetospirillum sulfuroxidans]MBR9972310.1 DUF4175 family protein [Magnetospirillum sulfuroxidans]